MPSNLDILALAAAGAKMPGDPSEVVVVRPKATLTGAVANFVGNVLGLLIRGAVISLAASHVEFVPDWGYWDSVWIGLLATWLFHANSGWEHWTKSWTERTGAARERLVRNTLKKAKEA